MTTKHYLLLACLVLPFVLFAQNTPVEEHLIRDSATKSTHMVAIQPTTDGGYVIAATTSATGSQVISVPGSNTGITINNHGGTDVLVVKVNAGGSIEWQKSLGGSGNDYAADIKQTADGGFIVASSISSTDGDIAANHGDFDTWLVKLNQAGSIEWQKNYGGSSRDVANTILQAKDKGYIFTASTNSTDGDADGAHPAKCYWCVKTDSLGNIQWKNYFAGIAFSTTTYGEASDAGFSVAYTTSYINASIIRATPDNGYIIAAQSDSAAGNGHGGIDYHVIKLDNNGNIVWQQLYGNNADNIVSNIVPVDNANAYLLVGSTATHIPLPNNPAAFIVTSLPYYTKIDNTGKLLWEKVDSTLIPANENLVHDYSVSANCATIAANGDYLVGGKIISAGFEQTYATGWLLRMDSAGNKTGVTYANYSSPFFAMATLADNSFIVGGVQFSLRGQPESTYVADMYYAKYAASVLPVHINQFTATKNNNSVQVQWQTAGELNTSHFNVQRSTNAVDFTTIGTVAAAGTSAVTRGYNYIDNVTKTGGSFAAPLYYRLQEVDKDGKITLSKTAKINPDIVALQVAVTPNPATNRLIIQVQKYTGKTAFTIYNMAGQAVKQVAANVSGNNQVTINIANLPAGSYVVSAVVNGNKVNQRFVKQ